MRVVGYGFGIVMAAIACAAGCAGNGEGLDQNGQPLGSSGNPGTGGSVTADLKSIQENVFTPICSKCHIGAGAPEGLELDAAHAYGFLVDVPSAEQPNLLRVKPGSPDDSYLVHKIEGLAGIDGGQMPLGQTPLPQAAIQAIRQWITDGAPNDVPATAATQGFAAARGFGIAGTFPVDRSVVPAPVKYLLVQFTQEVDATLVNDTTVALQSIDEDQPPNGAMPVAVSGALARHDAAVLLITPARPLGAGRYRVTLRGSGGGALANLGAETLGADASFEFTVQEAP